MRIFTRAALFAMLSLLLCLAPRAQARGDEPAVVRVETSDYDLTSEPYYGEQAGIFMRHGIALQAAGKTIQPPQFGGNELINAVARKPA